MKHDDAGQPSQRRWELTVCARTVSRVLGLQRSALVRTDPQALKAANDLLIRVESSLAQERKLLTSADPEADTLEHRAERESLEPALECIEGIADAVRSLMHQLQAKLDRGVYFSDLATREAEESYVHASRQVRDAADALATENPTLRAHVIEGCEEASAAMNEHTRRHEDRLLSGVCNDTAAAVYVALYDGFHNICYYVRHLALAIPEERGDI